MLSKQLVAMIGALVWSASAWGDCINVGDGRVTCLGQVKVVYSGKSHMLFQQYGNVVAALPCVWEDGASGYWKINRTDPMYREWYSLILTASAADATLYTVSEYANQTGNVCKLNRIEWRN